MLYSEYKIKGPYHKKAHGKKDAMILKLIDNNGKIKYISEARYNMEIYLNRHLNRDEIVVHIDGDYKNNDIKNLKVIESKFTSYENFKKYKLCDKEPYIGWAITGNIIPKSTLKSDKFRNYIRMRDPDNNIHIILYARYIAETEILGRFLKDNEQVDHINMDTLDDSIENLRIIKQSEHISDDNIRLVCKSFICPLCKKEFTPDRLRMQRISHSYRKAKKLNKKYYGPFCSLECARKSMKLISNNLLPESNIEIEYTTNKIDNLGLDKNNSIIRKHLNSVKKRYMK